MSKWVLLTNVTTEVEADIIRGLLKEANIPIQKAYPGVGNLKAAYGLINGVEIYVPAHLIEQAKTIIDIENGICLDSLSDQDK